MANLNAKRMYGGHRRAMLEEDYDLDIFKDFAFAISKVSSRIQRSRKLNLFESQTAGVRGLGGSGDGSTEYVNAELNYSRMPLAMSSS